MIPADKSSTSSLHLCLISGLLLTFLYFLTTWHIGINLADEGFYWYGAQRVFNGEVPILDFMSYDPGRYYIAASIMAMVGSDGIWAARVAAYFVLGLLVSVGIYLALLAFHGNRRAQLFYSLIVAMILIVWTFPNFRTFDFLAATMSLLAISFFIRQQSARGWFLSGLLVGMVAVIGRNHGVYGVIGHLVALAMIYLGRESAKPAASCYFSWGAGVVAGYLPVILLIVFVDGFALAFFDSIKSLVARGSTNIELPVPWPWFVDIGKLGVVLSVSYIAQGLFFVGLIAFPIAGLSYVVLSRWRGWPLQFSEAGNAVFLASVSLSLPYAHYAFSRADIEHLAPSMLPLLFGILSMPLVYKTRARISVGLLLLAAVLGVMVDTQPTLRYLVRNPELETYAIGTDKILIPSDQVASMSRLDRLVQAEIDQGGSFLALPNFMTLHAIHHQKIAVREIYSLFVRPKTYEEMEIERIAKMKPTLIVISNHALDKNESLRYSSTHPLIYQWVNTRYRRVDNADDLEIYRPR